MEKYIVEMHKPITEEEKKAFKKGGIKFRYQSSLYPILSIVYAKNKEAILAFPFVRKVRLAKDFDELFNG